MSVEDELSMGEATPVKRQDEAVEDAELSLSEVAVDEVLAKRDADRAIKGFDLRAWIDGVRSARTLVRLYARPDLDEQIQAVGTQILEAMHLGDKARIAELKERELELKREFLSASLDIVLEERSKEWQARKMVELKEAGVTDSKLLTLSVMAAQIVEPEGGFTGEDLLALTEVIPKQVNTLVEAWGRLSGESKGFPTF